MTQLLKNSHRGAGLVSLAVDLAGARLVSDPTAAKALFELCPLAEMTPLCSLDALAKELGIAALSAKDERKRLRLGSFKALGATHAIAKQAAARAKDGNLSQALAGETFVCASAGNHGLSVAAGARLFGARAVVYIAETVPSPFGDRLRETGAEVVIEGTDYEESMAAAMTAAARESWRLLSDSSWAGYVDSARDVICLLYTSDAADDSALV